MGVYTYERLLYEREHHVEDHVDEDDGECGDVHEAHEAEVPRQLLDRLEQTVACRIVHTHIPPPAVEDVM
eukprot:19572-Eustigmatos_ZCMA.PRE.1